MGNLSRRVLLGAMVAAAATGASFAQAPVRVVTSTTILADFVRAVGGERVSVASLVPANADAHVYQPTPADGRALAAAGLVVFNGFGLEGAGFSRLVRASGYRGTLVNAADGIAIVRAPGRHDHGHGGGRAQREVVAPGGVPDPHGWQNVANATVYARNIAAALARVDGAGAAVYQANAARFAQRMAELDAWVRSRIAAVPAPKRRVITTHEAFSYFGAAYGVEFIAAQGVSSEREPSAAQIARVIVQARRENVRALFIENMTNPRAVEQIARELGAPVGGTLYADALSGPDGPAPTYEALVRHNVEALVAGMQRN